MDVIPVWLPVVLAVIFGSAVGSFLNVLIWRLPREEAPTGRSHCPRCGHQLHAGDLVPLASFLITGRRCRYCKAAVSWRYFIIELVTAVAFGVVTYVMYPTSIVDLVVLSFYLFVVCVCIVVFVIDLEHYLILDRVVLPAIAVSLVWKVVIALSVGESILATSILGSIYGALAGFVPFFLLWAVSRGRWMGFGDVKFVAFMGAVLGITGIFVSLFVAFFLGTIVAIPLLLTGRKELSSKIPFGTFLAVATVVSLLFGNQLLWWYLGLIGL